jgi:hypothetical protein
VGFAGEVLLWKYEAKDGDAEGSTWEEKGEIIVGAQEYFIFDCLPGSSSS